MEIEQLEEWTGQNVVDRDGDKIGKLEDVYFESGSSEPSFACVKTGTLGRRHVVVPLAGARVSRDYLRVAFPHDQVKDGPQVQPGAPLGVDVEQELAGHYEIELVASPGGGERRYESASARAERDASSREATKRAEELEVLAERKAVEAREGALEADDTRRRAYEAEDERDRAERDAAEARTEAEEQRPPSP